MVLTLSDTELIKRNCLDKTFMCMIHLLHLKENHTLWPEKPCFFINKEGAALQQ